MVSRGVVQLNNCEKIDVSEIEGSDSPHPQKQYRFPKQANILEIRVFRTSGDSREVQFK